MTQKKLTLEQVDAIARAPWCYSSAVLTKALLQLAADLTLERASADRLLRAATELPEAPGSSMADAMATAELKAAAEAYQAVREDVA